MKATKIILLGVVGVFGLLMLIGFIAGRTMSPDERAMETVEATLRSKMKDPDSMVIRSSFVVSRVDTENGTTDLYICGIVDGHNSYGGYSGGQRFYSWSTYSPTSERVSTISVEVEDSVRREGALTPFEQVYWNPKCVDASHPPLQP